MSEGGAARSRFYGRLRGAVGSAEQGGSGADNIWGFGPKTPCLRKVWGNMGHSRGHFAPWMRVRMDRKTPRDHAVEQASKGSTLSQSRGGRFLKKSPLKVGRLPGLAAPLDKSRQGDARSSLRRQVR